MERRPRLLVLLLTVLLAVAGFGRAPAGSTGEGGRVEAVAALAGPLALRGHSDLDTSRAKGDARDTQADAPPALGVEVGAPSSWTLALLQSPAADPVAKLRGMAQPRGPPDRMS